MIINCQLDYGIIVYHTSSLLTEIQDVLDLDAGVRAGQRQLRLLQTLDSEGELAEAEEGADRAACALNLAAGKTFREIDSWREGGKLIVYPDYILH